MNKLWIKYIGFFMILLMQTTMGWAQIAPIAPNKVVDSLYQNDLKYTYLSINGTVNTDFNNQNITANFVMRLHHDSAVWVSVRAMGVEVVRAIITPDSIKVLNHLNRTYYARPFEYVRSISGSEVSFGQLQDVLVGNAGNFLSLMQNINQITDTTTQLTADTLGQRYTLIANTKTYKLQTTELQSTGIDTEKSLKIRYENPKNIGYGQIPTELSLKVVYNDKINEANFAYNKYNFAQMLAMPFKKPANYDEQ